MNAAPVVPVAVVALVTTGAGGLTVSVSVAVPLPPAFVALRVIAVVPAKVGVPETAPVPVFTVRPAGSPVAV